jgi:hypothetical protein
VKLSRHARNRLRWIRRRHPIATEARLLDALSDARRLGYDERGNLRVMATLGSAEVVLVIDEAAALVITMWVR